jgi:multidrug efflux pump subunit AcrA (membrane-fusion protein)
MIVSIVAIVLALIAGYLAFTYKGQVEDWEAAANETLEQLEAAGLELEDAIASSVADYEQQIDDLTAQLRQSQTESGISAGNLAQAREDLAATEAELESTQQDLTETQSQLEETQSQLDEVQTELDDANTRLEQLGELVLPNGTYVGAVLAARTGPIPAIIFQEGTAWRVAEVADDVRITSGGRELTLEEFATLLQSSDPADVALVNGNYQVKVNGGLVTSIRKSQA